MSFSDTYSALACDLDGTILDSVHELRDSVRDALREAADSYLHVILSSARPPRSVISFSQKINLKDPVIALNGALIMTPERTILHKESISPDNIEDVIALSKRHNLTTNLYSGYSWFVERIDKWVEVEIGVVKFEPEVVSSFNALDCTVEKLLIMGETHQLQTFREKLLANMTTVNASFSKPNFCEVTARTVSKSRALERVCGFLDLSLSRVVALGDGFNDLDMLEAAGLGVAMGNAPSEVRARADMVIRSNDEDGVAHFIHEVVFQRMTQKGSAE